MMPVRAAIAALSLALLFTGPANAGATKIAFVGDSIADGIWGAFFRLAGRHKCGTDEVVLIRDAKNGTGLARADTFDWFTEVDNLVAANKPDLVVASFGLNDAQAVVTPSKIKFTFGSDKWLAAYKQQVAAFYARATAHGARVLMVGLPPLRNAKANRHALRLNQVYAEIAKNNPTLPVTYVEPWKPSGSDGTFASYGSGLGGTVVQLRAPDGVHFTPAGYDVLAAYLKGWLSAALADRSAAVNGQCLGL